MAITDRSLFNNPELDYMMPDAAPPGVSVGPTGAGDPILDLLTPTTPNLGGGITTGGVPSFQTDVMGYTPTKEQEFLNQLSTIELNKLLQLAGDYERASKGGDVEPFPRYVYDAITAEVTKRSSIGGQAIIERDRVPAAGVFVGSPLESLQTMVDTVVEMGKETGKDIKEDWQTVKAQLGMPAEEGEKRLEEIKKEKEARVKPEDIRGDIITAMSQGEDVELPPTFTEGVTGERVTGRLKKIRDMMPDLTGWDTDIPYYLPGLTKPKGVGGVAEEEGPAEAEIISTETETLTEGSDLGPNTNQVLENAITDEKNKKSEESNEKKVISKEGNPLPDDAAAMQELITTMLSPEVRNTTTDPLTKTLQNTPQVVQMAAQINDYINGGRRVDATDAFYDLIEGIAAGLASEINPGVGIAKGAALGSAKFQERLAREKESKIKSIEEANDYLKIIGAMDAASRGDPLKETDKVKFSEKWQEAASGALASKGALKTIDNILAVVEGKELPIGAAGLWNEVQARFQTFIGNPNAYSERERWSQELRKISQQNLQAILQESGRTISDRDRQLLQDLFGTLTGIEAATYSPVNLALKLRGFRDNFESMLQDNLMSFNDMDERNQRLHFLEPSGILNTRRNSILALYGSTLSTGTRRIGIGPTGQIEILSVRAGG